MESSHGANLQLDGQAPPFTHLNSVTAMVSREFHYFVNDLEDLIKSTRALDKDDFEQAGAKLNARARALKSRFDDISDTMKTTATEEVKTLNEYVHHRPWIIVAAGAVVGLLMGISLAKRH